MKRKTGIFRPKLNRRPMWVNNKRVFITIDSDAEGKLEPMSRDQARKWFFSYLERLKDNDDDVLIISRHDMTREEVDPNY